MTLNQILIAFLIKQDNPTISHFRQDQDSHRKLALAIGIHHRKPRRVVPAQECSSVEYQLVGALGDHHGNGVFDGKLNRYVDMSIIDEQQDAPNGHSFTKRTLRVCLYQGWEGFVGTEMRPVVDRAGLGEGVETEKGIYD